MENIHYVNINVYRYYVHYVSHNVGISKAVLIHETVHAVQFCAGNGNVQTIGLEIMPIEQARPFYNRYLDTYSQEIEKEAYAVQTQSNSLELAIFLLKQHC